MAAKSKNTQELEDAGEVAAPETTMPSAGKGAKKKDSSASTIMAVGVVALLACLASIGLSLIMSAG